MARGRKPKFREIVGDTQQPVDLPPTHLYPQTGIKQEPGNVQYLPDYPRVVLTEVRSIFSDGSVTFEVRTNADNAHRR